MIIIILISPPTKTLTKLKPFGFFFQIREEKKEKKKKKKKRLKAPEEGSLAG